MSLKPIQAALYHDQSENRWSFLFELIVMCQMIRPDFNISCIPDFANLDSQFFIEGTLEVYRKSTGQVETVSLEQFWEIPIMDIFIRQSFADDILKALNKKVYQVKKEQHSRSKPPQHRILIEPGRTKKCFYSVVYDQNDQPVIWFNYFT